MCIGKSTSAKSILLDSRPVSWYGVTFFRGNESLGGSGLREWSGLILRTRQSGFSFACRAGCAMDRCIANPRRLRTRCLRPPGDTRDTRPTTVWRRRGRLRRWASAWRSWRKRTGSCGNQPKPRRTKLEEKAAFALPRDIENVVRSRAFVVSSSNHERGCHPSTGFQVTASYQRRCTAIFSLRQAQAERTFSWSHGSY